MSIGEPLPFSTMDGTLVGAVDNSNRTYTFSPLLPTFLYSQPNSKGYLLFRNGILQDEPLDYTSGPGWLTPRIYDSTDTLTARFFSNGVTKYRLDGNPFQAQATPSVVWFQFGVLAPTMQFALFRNGVLQTPFFDYTSIGPWNTFAIPLNPDDRVVAVTGFNGTFCTTQNGSITGIIDGSNTAFFLPFFSTEILLFRNGVLMTAGRDYILVGTLVLFTSLQIPQPGDVVSAYVYTQNGPVQASTFDGGLFIATSTSSLLFRNGVLMSQPWDGTTSGNVAVFDPFQTLRVWSSGPPDSALVEAWVPDATDAGQPPLNIPAQFSTADGSIIGAIDGHNNIFTLRTSSFVTQVMFWWNGVFLTEGVDYTWTNSQALMSGPYQTVLTMMGGVYPRPTDILTAEVFSQ